MAGGTRWLAQLSTLLVTEAVVYVLFVALGFYLLSVAAAYVPFFWHQRHQRRPTPRSTRWA